MAKKRVASAQHSKPDGPQAGGWHDLDRTGEVETFVRCLDAISAFHMAQSLKRRTFDLLEPAAGRRLLDVGCGTGDDARALAGLVAPDGLVVGVDSSEGMIEEASARSAGLGRTIEFRVGSALALDFPDGSFDGCRADRVFQHLVDPGAALAEMARVTRPGGRLVVIDPDWETLLIDHDDRALTRRILNNECDTHRNGWSGRRLYGLSQACGLVEIGVAAETWSTTDVRVLGANFDARSMVREAVDANVVSPPEGDRWLSHLDQRIAGERFFGALTLFIVWGRTRTDQPTAAIRNSQV